MKLATDGCEIIDDIFTSDEVDGLIAELPESTTGLRNLLNRCEAVRELAYSAKIAAVLEQLGCLGARPVRALFFDKNPAHNWKVPWHQDLTIAVAARVETTGFQAWSVKEGVIHVQPPAELLRNMVSLRLNLDHCGPDDGPLRVLPGSHCHGRLNSEEIAQFKQSTAEVVCHVQRGGIVAMRPLTLHASSPASKPQHRRVVHIEFSPDHLPGGLAWFENAVYLPANFQCGQAT